LRAGIFYTDDLLTEPSAYHNRSLGVPDGPGVGIGLDEEEFAHHRVG
jgi:L-alanine-DL-glutamate epimerase-like enolase superfamily enzyme